MLVGLGFSETAEAVYRLLLERQDASIYDLAAGEDYSLDQIEQAHSELIESGLVVPSVERPGSVVVIDPSVALDRLIARRNADLAREQQTLAESRKDMSALVDRFMVSTRRTRSVADTVDLLGADAIRRTLEEWNQRVQREVLAIHPSANYDGPQLQQATCMDVRALERGVTMRSIYTHSSRADDATWRYQSTTAEHGALIRYVENAPMRMLIFDREAGLVPMHAVDNGRSAVLLRGEALTAVLVLSFEQLWANGDPIDAVTTAPVQPQRDVIDPTDLDRTLLKLLAMGVKDEATARHLGVSVRTVRRQIADLMLRLEAGSRFEAGMQAVIRGWIEPPRRG